MDSRDLGILIVWLIILLIVLIFAFIIWFFDNQLPSLIPRRLRSVNTENDDI